MVRLKKTGIGAFLKWTIFENRYLFFPNLYNL